MVRRTKTKKQAIRLAKKGSELVLILAFKQFAFQLGLIPLLLLISGID